MTHTKRIYRNLLRKELVSCVTHLQSCAKVNIWKKRKNCALLLRSKLKITEIEDYKKFLQKFKITKIEYYKILAQLQLFH